jgi:hypothetical protein
MEIEAQGDTAVQATDAMTVKQTACTPPTHSPNHRGSKSLSSGAKQKTSTYFQIHLLPNPLSACYKQKPCTCFEIPFPLLQIEGRERERERERAPPLVAEETEAKGGKKQPHKASEKKKKKKSATERGTEAL